MESGRMYVWMILSMTVMCLGYWLLILFHEFGHWIFVYENLDNKENIELNWCNVTYDKDLDDPGVYRSLLSYKAYISGFLFSLPISILWGIMMFIACYYAPGMMIEYLEGWYVISLMLCILVNFLGSMLDFSHMLNIFKAKRDTSILDEGIKNHKKQIKIITKIKHIIEVDGGKI